MPGEEPQRRARGAMPVQRVRGERPDDPEWRADALAGSRHSRLIDELSAPLEDRDPERARALCAEVTRGALLDFAPALIPLPPAERERVQALAAFVLTLFDFARQTGLEGERLSQINRWEFNLELALDGDPPAQPVFIQLASAEKDRAWPREGLEGLLRIARRRATVPPRSPEAAQSERRALAVALGATLLDEPLHEAAREFAAALLGVRALQGLGEELRRGRPGLGVGAEQGGLPEAIRSECQRLRAALRTPSAVRALPALYRRPAAYLYRASLGILRSVEHRGEGIIERPPRLGALARIIALVRAWAA